MELIEQAFLTPGKLEPDSYRFTVVRDARDIIDIEDDIVPIKRPYAIVTAFGSSHPERLIDITGWLEYGSTACTMTIAPTLSFRLPEEVADNIVTATTATGSFDVLIFSCEGVSLESDNIDYDPLEIKVESEAVNIDRAALYMEALGVYRDSNENNWDGYGAPAISERAFREALELIDLFPSNFPLPEPSAEASGEIVFEWYKGPRNLLIIGVSGQKTITYAGLFGKISEAHGVEYFNGKFPTVIVDHLNHLYK